VEYVPEKRRVREHTLGLRFLLPAMQAILDLVHFCNFNEKSGSLLVVHEPILRKVFFFDRTVLYRLRLFQDNSLRLVLLVYIFEHINYILSHFESLLTRLLYLGDVSLRLLVLALGLVLFRESLALLRLLQVHGNKRDDLIKKLVFRG